MKTPQWIKGLGGYSGELYVEAELSKRGILTARLPENYPDDDLVIFKRGENKLSWIQVKSCHPERSTSFRLNTTLCKWKGKPSNEYVVLVWLGNEGATSPTSRVKQPTPTTFWLVKKTVIGEMCSKYVSTHPKLLKRKNNELRFWPDNAFFDENNIRRPKRPDLQLKEQWRIISWHPFNDYLSSSF